MLTDGTVCVDKSGFQAAALGGPGGHAAAAATVGVTRLAERGRPFTSDPLSDPSFSDLGRLRPASALTETVSGARHRGMGTNCQWGMLWGGGGAVEQSGENRCSMIIRKLLESVLFKFVIAYI